MNKIKRPMLLTGLIFTTFELVVFIATQLFVKNDDVVTKIVFWFCIVTLLINISSFYTVNLSAKEFKKQRYFPWISFVLILIYNLYYLALLIINLSNGLSTTDILMLSNYFIITVGMILFIPGCLKKIVDNKISYNEHIGQKKLKK